MPELRVSELAQGDIKDIGRYTQETWGVRQRDRYLNLLDQCLRELVTTRAFDRNREDIRPRLLSRSFEKHMIFFRRDIEGNVEILRILGQSMDFERHL